MKTLLLATGALALSRLLWAFDLTGADYVGSVGQGWLTFLDNTHAESAITVGGRYRDIETTYGLREVGKVPFLSLSDGASSRLLFLYSPQLCFAFGPKSELVLLGINQNGPAKLSVGVETVFQAPYILKATEYSASSALREGPRQYAASGLGEIRPNNPWVEGVPGPGIGQKLTAKWDVHPGGAIEILIFSNGFVSYDKPNLYLENGRVRRIHVTNSASTIDYFTDLADTPNPQFIILPSATFDVTLEIITVYDGTRWADTCVNFLLGATADLRAFLSAGK